MKIIILSFIYLFGCCIPMFGQNKSTKIYFYSYPSNSLITLSNPDKPIKIKRCTLLETNLDSLGIEVLPGKNVYLHFEAGRTYYYHQITTNPTGNGGTSILSECTEQEFWLNVYFIGAGTYRHYFLDKQSGLKLLEEKYK